jgi:rhodanese-related sulfurtransferase
VVDLYTEQVKDISVDDLKNRMKSGKGLMILDVRDLQTYCKGHIPGACDLFDAEMANLGVDADKNAAIIVYGPGQSQRSENPADRLSGDAIDKLKKEGFNNVMELRGGYEAWANAGNRVDSCDLQSITPAKVPLMMDTGSGQRDL